MTAEELLQLQIGDIVTLQVKATVRAVQPDGVMITWPSGADFFTESKAELLTLTANREDAEKAKRRADYEKLKKEFEPAGKGK